MPSGPGGVDVLLGHGDGNLDVAQLDYATPSAPYGLVQFLWGNGNGTFRDGGTVLAHASQAIALAVRNVNGDGRPDLLIGHGNDHCCYQFAQVSV